MSHPFPRFRPSALTGLLAALLAGLVALKGGQPAQAEDKPASPSALFARPNLVAWCIVPFDSHDRGPEKRAAMLRALGLTKFAYDYRAQHVPTFDAEMEALKRQGVELTAWWFPGSLTDEAKHILAVLKRHGIKTQLWVTGGGAATQSPEDQRARVKAEAARLRPIVEAAGAIGCSVGLYNHGGWFGEPENQLEILAELAAPNVGIVYNLHHGHDHLDRFADLLQKMRPHLYCLNLNGMVPGGDKRGQKILPLGEGTVDLTILRTIMDSGYTGPIGILNHTQHDAEHRLLDNLERLDWLVAQLDGAAAGPKPTLRTPDRPPAPASAVKPESGVVLDGRDAFRTPPLTVACRASLTDAQGYNILVASDPKASGAHWELFTMAGTGTLTAYLPGMSPDHVRSPRVVTDGKPHTFVMTYEPTRVRLFVDGVPVADQAVSSIGKPAARGGLGIGRLVEGGISHRGTVEQVVIMAGARVPSSANDLLNVDAKGGAFLVWADGKVIATAPTKPSGHGAHGGHAMAKPAAAPVVPPSSAAPPYSPELVQKLLAAAQTGNPQKGAMVFSSSKTACLACHKVGATGGVVGPELTKALATQSPEKVVESLFWPQREVKPEYAAVMVLTDVGQVVRGYKVSETDDTLVLRDVTTNQPVTLQKDEIEARREGESVMPEGLTNAMSPLEQADLIRFLLELRTASSTDRAALEMAIAHAQGHAPVAFEYSRLPLHPEHWPNHTHPLNEFRVYDFYAKQAMHFKKQSPLPPLVIANPGLDGGKFGHWGNQDENTWANDAWNQVDVGSLLSGVFRLRGVTVPRGIVVRLGDDGEVAACFNPDTGTYDSIWRKGFLTFSAVRHGFMHGLTPPESVESLPLPKTKKLEGAYEYLGFHRFGKRVAFRYRIDGVEYLDCPWLEEGQFVRVLAPAAEHPLAQQIREAAPQWPQKLTTTITAGSFQPASAGSAETQPADGKKPYAVDTIALPWDNPWKARVFPGGHAFLEDGSAVVCTMHGDVWRVSGLEPASKQAVWRRIAAGLHQAQGIVADKDGIFVLGRDQITRLHDHNGDGETDYYEAFSRAYVTSTAGHDFICGLERDAEGRFYLASGNQGLVRVAADGKSAEVLATGFRNPDGLGLYPDGTVTVPVSEGNWTPATAICAVRPGGQQPGVVSTEPIGGHVPPYFGYGGPRNDRAPDLPMLYLPRALDNSAGGQAYINSDRWGPLQGLMVHTSYGAGCHFLLLRDEVAGQIQGAAVLLPGEFLSGAHRASFSPHDGQLYVTGMGGWGHYNPENGCFHRVRYTGGKVRLPIGFHVHANGVAVTFSEPLDRERAAQVAQHFAQCWNYRYSGGYGSPEFSPSHQGVKGHDVLPIRSATVADDGRTLFLEIPTLQPVSQLHLHLDVWESADPVDMFLTVHRLDTPYTNIPGYVAESKEIAPHPMVNDLRLASLMVPNPWKKEVKDSRGLTLKTDKNLNYATRVLKAKAGEKLRFTLDNPDVVPHNWALLKPGTLQAVGQLANHLIADPDAFARHYIPQSDDVLYYTDVVLPGEKFTIYITAPAEPGRYPYVCTFPGHWMVMNGELVVE